MFRFNTAVLLVVGFSSIALGHGPQIQVDVVEGRIVTRGIAPDTAYDVVQPETRAYLVEMIDIAGAWIGNGNPDEHIGPGFVLLPDRFAAGTRLRLSLLDGLKIWNGSGFVDPGDEQMQISHSSGAVTLTSADAIPATGIDLLNPIANSAGEHRSVRYMLLGDGTNPLAASDDGIYLLTLELAHADAAGAPTTVANSLPFYMLFNKGSDSSTASAAMNHVQQVLIPEPGGFAMFALAGLLLRRTRRQERGRRC